MQGVTPRTSDEQSNNGWYAFHCLHNPEKVQGSGSPSKALIENTACKLKACVQDVSQLLKQSDWAHILDFK